MSEYITNRITNDIISFSQNKKMVLLWSGGFESTYLLKLFVSQRMYEHCDLDVLSIAFPQDVYDMSKMHTTIDFLNSLGINTEFIVPNITMNKKDIAYSKACLVCKDVRRDVINKYIHHHKGESLSFITGHNLDDLISYLLENIVTTIAGDFEKKYERYLETANKFFDVFCYNEFCSIYRPLLQYEKHSLQECTFGDLENIISVNDKECYWSKQRKRIIQMYLKQSGMMFDFSRTYEMFDKVIGFPPESNFHRLPFETYLL